MFKKEVALMSFTQLILAFSIIVQDLNRSVNVNMNECIMFNSHTYMRFRRPLQLNGLRPKVFKLWGPGISKVITGPDFS